MPTAAISPATNNERLTDSGVLDARGNRIDPGDAFPLPPEHRVPTMLVDRELNYLHWLGRNVPAGGRVVELGCFLGGSSAALVEGMRASGLTYPPVLVYDAFVAPDSEAIVKSWWMKPYGLHANENFRTKYETLHASRLDRMIIREGWIPEVVDRAGERTVYPEQEPINLLFVDAAKTWGVHLTILRAFVRHMIVGSVLVQQDFFDVHTPWLPLHMWQLRDVLRPLDVVRGTPSVAFECVASTSASVDEVWPDAHIGSAAAVADVWRSVLDYWSGLIGADAAGFIHGHAARHAALLRDYAGFTRHARAYEAWATSGASVNTYVTPAWTEMIRAAMPAMNDTSAVARNARDLVAECVVRRELPRCDNAAHAGAFFSTSVRNAVWQRVIDRLRSEGHTRIALYGAGSHTEWLLGRGWIAPDISIAAIIDDAPTTPSIGGVPVINARDAMTLLRGVTAIVPSSDAHEQAIVSRSLSLFTQTHGIPTLRVYFEPREVELHADTSPQPSVSGQHTSVRLSRVDVKALQSSAPHRASLGLTRERPWLAEFARRTGQPEWVKGHVNYRDALLLWDLVEAVRPDEIIEIGTASGVSTALLATASDFFGGTTAPVATVHTFDISSRCYFDDARAVGSAAKESVPHLMDQIRINPNRTSVDAARSFRVGSVDLAFIDGDHRHPAPTLDVLALLYTLRPGAWIILHDIELSAVARVSTNADWTAVTGAETLFHLWPFQKVQPQHDEPSLNNIGAIRLPDDPADAVRFLLDHLSLAWETSSLPPPAIVSALALRGGLTQNGR